MPVTKEQERRPPHMRRFGTRTSEPRTSLTTSHTPADLQSGCCSSTSPSGVRPNRTLCVHDSLNANCGRPGPCFPLEILACSLATAHYLSLMLAYTRIGAGSRRPLRHPSRRSRQGTAGRAWRASCACRVRPLCSHPPSRVQRPVGGRPAGGAVCPLDHSLACE